MIAMSEISTRDTVTEDAGREIVSDNEAAVCEPASGDEGAVFTAAFEDEGPARRTASVVFSGAGVRSPDSADSVVAQRARAAPKKRTLEEFFIAAAGNATTVPDAAPRPGVYRYM
jgi:hypothetical protein